VRVSACEGSACEGYCMLGVVHVKVSACEGSACEASACEASACEGSPLARSELPLCSALSQLAKLKNMLEAQMLCCHAESNMLRLHTSLVFQVCSAINVLSDILSTSSKLVVINKQDIPSRNWTNQRK